MNVLLDTNICVAFLNGEDKKVRDRLLALNHDEVFLCSVVKAELLYGARNSQKVDANLRKLDEFFRPFTSLPFDDLAAAWYGTLRAQLKRAGTMIGANDLLIASIALSTDTTLATRNGAEFHRVPGLRVESW